MGQDLIFLLLDTPLKWWGFLVFGGIGALMGHLLWFVSQDQLDRLAGEQENLRDQIETLRRKVAERDRMKRESNWTGGIGKGGLLAGLKGFGRWLEGASKQPEPVQEPLEEEQPSVPAEPEEDDFTRLEGVDEAAAERLRAAGVTSFQQLSELESMSPEERARFAESFDLPPIPLSRWRWAWAPPETIEAEPGITPLPEFAGISAAGVAGLEPLAPPPEEPAPVAASEPAPETGDAPVPEAFVPEVFVPEAPLQDATAVREVEVAFSRPEQADDLTQIRGIDRSIEAALNGEGIFTFEQIAAWTPVHVREISDKLDLADRIIMQHWTSQAAALLRERQPAEPPAPSASEPAEAPSPAELEDLQTLHRSHYEGETGSFVDTALGVIYREKPELTDPLQRIENLDESLEERLNRLGVFRFKQIADWTGPQLTRIARLLGVAGERLEEEQWVPQAQRLHAETYPVETSWEEAEPSLSSVEERMRHDYAGEPVRADASLGVIYHSRPLIVDDLQRIRGVGPVIQRQLQEAGIYRFKQIAGWAPSHVRGVARLLSCFPDRIYRDRWIPQARDLARGPVLHLPRMQVHASHPAPSLSAIAAASAQPPAHAAAPVPVPSPVPAAPAAATTPLPAVGETVTVVDHAVDQFAILQSRFSADSQARVDPRLGIVYPGSPPFLDDLTRIPGIDGTLQEGLHALGIYRFKQIAAWSDENATEIARRLGIEKIRMRDGDWPGQAEARYQELFHLPNGWEQPRPALEQYEQRIREQFPGEPVKADEDYGIVYTAQPSRTDDLATLEGIDAALARRLQSCGVYRFRQIANWSAANIDALARRLGFPAEAPYHRNWVGQALANLPSEAQAQPAEPELKGAARLARDTGAGYNDQFGYLYPQRPARVDDLRAIRGVDGRMAGLLNHQGIYRFWQIEHWTNAQRDVFAQRLGLGNAVAEQRWREQCRRLALLSEAQQAFSCPAPEEVDQFSALADEFAGEPGVRVDPRLGIVYDQRPSVADPLTSIQGLDGRHEQVLHSLGIFRFKQMANWKDENVSALAPRLGLPKEALERGKWVAQAIDRERSLYAASPRWSVDRPALADYERLIPELFAGESVRADEELGVIFTGTPTRVDELHRIPGLDPELERRLNAAGVYTFRQIANWSAANVDAYARLLRIPRDRIYVQRWMAQAQAARPSDAPAPPLAPPSRQEPEVDHFAVFQREFAGEPGARVDRRLGIVYDQPPGDSDEFTRLPGVDERCQAALNQLGIYRFRQVAHWDAATVREAARRLQLDPEAVLQAGWPALAARHHTEIYRASAIWSVPRPALADYEARLSAEFPAEPVFADEELGYLFRGRPGRADDLSRVQGITGELERQLQAAGVFRFRQIALWSEANVESLERFLGLPRGRIYRQHWIPQAAALAQEQTSTEGSGVPAVPPPPPAEQGLLADQAEVLERMFAGEAGARVDRRYGIVFDQTPEVMDDLSLLRGVSPDWQGLLNELGIYRFKQIAYWSEGNLEQVAARLDTSVERIRQEDWRGQATRLHNEIYSASPMWTVARPALEDYQQEIDEDFAGERVRADADLGIIYVGEPARRDDLSRIPGVDPALARRLNVSGVYRFKQIARWSEANVEAFARWLGCPPDRIYRNRWIPQSAILATSEPEEAAPAAPVEAVFARYAADPSIRWDSELGWLYRDEPDVRDDLKLIRGVDGSLQDRLAGYGIHRFWQIARWSPEQLAAFAARLQRGDLPGREEWVRQAGVLALLAEADETDRFTAPREVDHFEVIEREFPGEFALLADPVYGIVYGERPEVLDDLTRIEGLTGLLSEKLHHHGVYRYKQIARWTDANVEAFARLLDLPKEQIERQKWVPRAARLHRQAYQPGKAWTMARPTVEEYEQRIRERFAGERVKADPDCGIIYVGRPGHIDDLTDVDGIDASMARRLHATGIYCFRQLENWAETNVLALAKRLDITPERIYLERWIQQAEGFPCQLPKRAAPPEAERAPAAPEPSLEDEPGMKRDERLGLVFRQRPNRVDHLRSIKGVGPKIERRLNEMGVFRYRQMAGWNERQVKEYADRLHLWGRIDRERWVDQARELAELTEAEAQDVFLAPERVDQMAILDAEFGHEPAVRVDPYLGIVFDEPPTVVDDLSLIDGIGHRLETELNHLGVFRYNQIAAWSSLNVAHFARHLYCDQERIERDKWIPQARRLYRDTYSASWAWGVSHPTPAEYQARIEEEFSTEAVRADEALGIIYTGWPSHVDELTRIQGVSRELERSLNRLGVFTFDQIANWAEANVEAFASRLGLTPQQIYRDRWIAQAADLAGQVPPVPTVIPHLGSPDPRLYSVLSGDPGLQADEQFGLVYTQPPAQIDPLTAIRGIGSRLETELHKLGIHRHRQIACWAERNIKAVSERLRLGGRIERENWVTQAKELTALAESEAGRLFVAPATVDQDSILLADFAGESGVRIDSRLGIVYDTAPEVRDDLTLISGVGPRLQEELQELGIYRFKQIAAWSDGNVGEFAQRLFCYKDRIERDKWIPQARRLHRDIYRASPEWGIPRPTVSDYEERIATEFPGSGLYADRDYGLLYREEPAWADPLTRLPGVSPRIEGELRDAGVFTFAQIATWSEACVEAFAALLRIPRDRIYRDRWIPQATALRERETSFARSEDSRSAAPETPVIPVARPRSKAALPAATLAPEEIRRPERKRPEPSPSPSRLAREAREREEREAREREEREEREARERQEQEERERIAREERERLAREERERLAREERDRQARERAQEEARRRAEEQQRQREERERAEEERRAREERQRALQERKEREAQERAAQIRRERRERDRDARPARVAAPPAAPARELKAEPPLPSNPELEHDERLGEVYRRPPGKIDDLKLIRGVGPRLERQLNDQGVYRFHQIASWTRRNVDEFSRLLEIRDRINRDNWVEQAWEMARLAEEDESQTYEAPAEVDSTSVLEREFAGEWGVGVDEDLGILYEERPEVVDDLKLIRGIGARLERELHSYGVYRFKQIAHWSDRQVEAFATRLNCPKERIEKDKWIPQAKLLHREVYAASTEWGAYRPGIADFRAKIEEEFSGEDVVTDAEYGIVYPQPPDQADDLRELRNLDHETAQVLNGAGVYRFKQIANWSDANVAAFAALLDWSPERIYRERWIAQARELADSAEIAAPDALEEPLDQEAFLASRFAGEDALLDPDLGILYQRPPVEVDDLKRIRGVGRKLEQSLNAFGVYQYRQIALWTRENAEEFASRLNAFKDRIFRDNWMKQARLLHEEKYGESLDLP